MTSSASWLLALAALGAAVGAQAVGAHANQLRDRWPDTVDPPFAPSPGAAPYLSLGYREMLADILWIRAVGYVGGTDDRASITRQLVESIVALDPRFERVYAWGGLAMSAVGTNATRDDFLAAIRVLEQGMIQFPDNWKLPLYAGQIYTVELESDDADEVRRWQLEGARLLERAVRLPGAPKDAATYAAYLRTQLGQRDKARRDLRELILYTSDPAARDKLIAKLAELEDADRDALDYELEVEQRRFERAWQAARPELPPTMYLLVGPPIPAWFDPGDLAVDRDLIGSEPPVEPLPPVPD